MVSTGTHVQEDGGTNRIAPLQKALVGPPPLMGVLVRMKQNGWSNRIAPLQKMLVGRPHFDGENWHACAVKCVV